MTKKYVTMTGTGIDSYGVFEDVPSPTIMSGITTSGYIDKIAITGGGGFWEIDEDRFSYGPVGNILTGGVPSVPQEGDYYNDGSEINIYLGGGWHVWASPSGEGVTDHNLLTDLQGGTTGQYYHLTSGEHTNVGNLASAAYETVGYFDLSGAAGTAQTNAETYASGTVLPWANTNAQGYATTAINTSESYADGKVSSTAYNSVSWAGVTTVAPSKDAINSEIITMNSASTTVSGALVTLQGQYVGFSGQVVANYATQAWAALQYDILGAASTAQSNSETYA